MIRSIRSWRSWRIRYEIDSRVAGSAQCRSSTTNTTGSTGEPLEHAEDGVEQARLERLGLRSLVGAARPSEHRHEAREIGAGRPDHRVEDLGFERPDERPERLDDRTVRDATVTDVGAAPDDDAHASRSRERGGLGDEARLADAGLTRDELVNRRGHHRVVERPAHRRELRRASDERRADQAAWHRQMIRVDHPAAGCRVRD